MSLDTLAQRYEELFLSSCMHGAGDRRAISFATDH